MKCSALLQSLWRKCQRLMDNILKWNSKNHFHITCTKYFFHVVSFQIFIIFLFQTQQDFREKMREYTRKQKIHSLIPCKAYNDYSIKACFMHTQSLNIRVQYIIVCLTYKCLICINYRLQFTLVGSRLTVFVQLTIIFTCYKLK